ncbi:MAG: SDR family oxidoreductase [Acidimicrobiia bacterium]|nr:SDR family oxidoreductase [Acidimicrobiia bacterium]
MKILVTGASGYIGGRLVPALLEAGHEVRCMSRNPTKLDDDPWRERVEVVEADVLDKASLDAALEGCDAAFYLVHSMGEGDFTSRDREAATNFSEAAATCGLRRIVYLGGLGEGDDLSAHLASRHEVGKLLASGATPVTELRAAVIIGSGSVSFEMLRHLTEVLPVMITPKWVSVRCQPIAIRNVLEIMVNVIADDGSESCIIEIGGPDVLTYAEMMQQYANEAGLPRRIILPVPVLTPQLSSRWIGLVTPLPTGVARPLVDSLRHEVVVGDMSASRRLAGELIPYRDALGLALEKEAAFDVATRWSDAGLASASPQENDPEWSGRTVYRDVQTVETTASAEDLFWAFSRIGGDVGYYTFNWAWRVRGVLDSIVGGVGLRRGRRHPEQLRSGEALDFWRVSSVEPGKRLQLSAEMLLPGEAWLEFVINEGDPNTLTQTASFYPKGLFGRLYWFVLVPFHVAIFGRMARRIASAAESRHVPV